MKVLKPMQLHSFTDVTRLPAWGSCAAILAVVISAPAWGIGPGQPFFDSEALNTNTEHTQALAFGDVDGDGDIDVVEGRRLDANRLYINDGTGVLGSSVAIDTRADDTQDVLLEDVDNDGDLDIIVANAGARILLHLNDGAGGFDGGSSISADSNDTRSLAWGDVTGDGIPDVLAGNANGANRYYAGDGTGGFASGADADTGAAVQTTSHIELADIDGDGVLDLVEGNRNQTNRYYPGVGVITPPAAAFGAAVAIQTDTDTTRDLAVADVDVDGDIDVIAGNDDQSDKVYLNDGTGAFPQTVTLGGATSTVALVVADMDGDTFLDIVSGIDNAENLIYYGDGSGLFTVGAQVSGEVDPTADLVATDIDGDADLDLLEGNAFEVNRIFSNLGGRTFSDADCTGPEYECFAFDSFERQAVALADVDGDGDLDIIEGKRRDGAFLYRNDGAGAFFATPESVTRAFDTNDLAMADLNGDGNLDIVEVNGRQINRRTFGDGTGAFPFGRNIGDENEPKDVAGSRAVALADFDGDGDIDIAVANDNINSGAPGDCDCPNRLYRNNGSGQFNTGEDLEAVLQQSYGIAAGDVDGDGDADLVIANFAALNRVLYNDGTGAFPTTSVIAGTGGASRDVALADLDADGDLDIVFANTNTDNSVYYNDGTGSFPQSTALPDSAADTSWSLTILDADNDGNLDIVTGNRNTPNRLYLNDGQGNFPAATAVTALVKDTQGLAAGDLNGTGSLDLVAADNFDYMRVYVNGNPFTSGLSDLFVDVNALPTQVDLFAAFADPVEPDDSLTYEVVANTDPALVQTTVDSLAGILTLTYAQDASGVAELTVRATNSNGLFVDAAFAVTVNEVRMAPAFLLDVGDINGNNAADVAVLVRNGDPGNVVYVKDGSTGELLSSFDLGDGNSLDMDLVPDVSGNGAPEIAVLVLELDGTVRVYVQDAATGALVRQPTFPPAWAPRFLGVIPDAPAGPALAVIGVRDDGDVKVHVKDAVTGNLVGGYPFASNYPPKGLVVIDDVTGNGISDVAVIGRDLFGAVRVQLKDGITGELRHWIQYAQAFDPLELIGIDVNGAPALGVLQTHPDGRVRVQVKDAETRAPVNSGAVSFAKDFVPFTAVATPNQGGSAAEELAVLGIRAADGAVRAQLKDAATGAALGLVFFAKTFEPKAFASIGDVNGNGQAELAVLGVNAAGNYRVQIKDAVDGSESSVFFVP